MMEVLWDDLARDSLALASPEWHVQELSKTERAFADNQTHFVAWETAKQALRDNTV